jgi:hypothetical protein
LNNIGASQGGSSLSCLQQRRFCARSNLTPPPKTKKKFPPPTFFFFGEKNIYNQFFGRGLKEKFQKFIFGKIGKNEEKMK